MPTIKASATNQTIINRNGEKRKLLNNLILVNDRCGSGVNCKPRRSLVYIAKLSRSGRLRESDFCEDKKILEICEGSLGRDDVPAVDCRKYKDVTRNGGLEKFFVEWICPYREDLLQFSFRYLSMLNIENQTAVMNLPIKLTCNVTYNAQQALCFNRTPPFRDK